MGRNYKEVNMSFVTNHSRVQSNLSIEQLYQTIKGGDYKAKVDTIRALYNSGDEEKATKIKQKLPGVTISGTFKPSRTGEHLENYSGYLCLDIDDLDPDELIRQKQAVKELSYTVMAFISPSGCGLKVIVGVDTGSDQHKKTYKQVQAYYEKALDCKCDNTTSDVTRLCYLSHDPEAFLNPDAEVFPVTMDQQIQEVKVPSVICTDTIDNDSKKVFRKAISYTNNKEEFKKGNRNKYVFLLSCNCNRYGLTEHLALELIINQYQRVDFKADEITKTVNSAYSKFKRESGIWVNRPKRSAPITKATQSMPVVKAEAVFIGDTVYEGLPGFLKNILSSISDKRERDVALTASLVMLSSMLPNIYGMYDGKVVYPNLYALVAAPPANNKGVIEYIRGLFKALISNVLMPGNTTTTVLLDGLKANKGVGLLCETETDALAYLTNKEPEGFNHITNNAFHHEQINISRKSTEKTVWVNTPKLSMLLSGVPQQIKSIVKATHSGMFSRFIIYQYNSSYIWKDVSNSNKSINPETHAGAIDEFKRYITELQKSSVRFQCTDQHWNQLNNHYSVRLQQLSVADASDMAAVVKRMGLITFRIAMILTVLRCFENGEVTTTITCNSEDFTNSIHLASVYLQHAEVIYSNMGCNNDKLSLGSNLIRLYEILPDQFDRKTAIELAGKNNIHISERTVDNYLKRLLTDGLLEHSYNKYSRKQRSIDISGCKKAAA